MNPNQCNEFHGMSDTLTFLKNQVEYCSLNYRQHHHHILEHLSGQYCPAQAVQGVNQFKVTTCVDFRLQAQSACQDRCLSRLACPVAPEHCYEQEQISYHYSHSLTSIRRYYRQ